MAKNFRLWQDLSIVNLLKPAADAAGRTSAYISLKYAHKAYVMCEVNQGNAAQVTFTVLQATDNLGTNSKVVNAMPIAVNLDTDTIPTDQFTFPANAANYQTDAGLKNKIVVFEILPESVLDINNTALGLNQGAYSHIAVQTSASNAANITAAQLLISPPAYQQQNPLTNNV